METNTKSKVNHWRSWRKPNLARSSHEKWLIPLVYDTLRILPVAWTWDFTDAGTGVVFWNSSRGGSIAFTVEWEDDGGWAITDNRNTPKIGDLSRDAVGSMICVYLQRINLSVISHGMIRRGECAARSLGHGWTFIEKDSTYGSWVFRHMRESGPVVISLHYALGSYCWLVQGTGIARKDVTACAKAYGGDLDATVSPATAVALLDAEKDATMRHDRAKEIAIALKQPTLARRWRATARLGVGTFELTTDAIENKRVKGKWDREGTVTVGGCTAASVSEALAAWATAHDPVRKRTPAAHAQPKAAPPTVMISTTRPKRLPPECQYLRMEDVDTVLKTLGVGWTCERDQVNRYPQASGYTAATLHGLRGKIRVELVDDRWQARWLPDGLPVKAHSEAAQTMPAAVAALWAVEPELLTGYPPTYQGTPMHLELELRIALSTWSDGWRVEVRTDRECVVRWHANKRPSIMVGYSANRVTVCSLVKLAASTGPTVGDALRAAFADGWIRQIKYEFDPPALSAWGSPAHKAARKAEREATRKAMLASSAPIPADVPPPEPAEPAATPPPWMPQPPFAPPWPSPADRAATLEVERRAKLAADARRAAEPAAPPEQTWVPPEPVAPPAQTWAGFQSPPAEPVVEQGTPPPWGAAPPAPALTQLEAMRLRAERAEAEMRACCGDAAALDPYLPSHWERDTNAFAKQTWRRKDSKATAVFGSSPVWYVGAAFPRQAASGSALGILAAMDAADAWLAHCGPMLQFPT